MEIAHFKVNVIEKRQNDSKYNQQLLYPAANLSVSYAQTLLFCRNLTKYKNSIYVSPHYVDNPYFTSDPGTLATNEYLTTPFRKFY